MNRLAVVHAFPKTRRLALAVLAGAVCTLSAQANIPLPNTPLQTGSAIPPNITMLIDDSGSMYWRYLYIHNADGTFPTITDDRSGGTISSSASGDEVSNDNFGNCDNCVVTGDASSNNGGYNQDKYMVDKTYVTNGLYYNPNVPYSPWHFPDGTPVADAPYTAVFQDHNNATYSWTAVDGSTKINTTSATTDMTGYINTYYVPKSASVDTSKAYNYYRFQILKNGTIYRSELLLASDVGSTTTPPDTTPYDQSGLSTAKNTMKQLAGISVPANASSVDFTISGGGSKAVLYEKSGSQPSTGSKDNTKAANGSFTINNPAAGTYYIALYGNNAAVSGVTITVVIHYDTSYTVTSGVTGVGCNDTNSSGYDWRNCTSGTPTGRNVANEKQNFANWYSFYETRIKTAKAGLTAAFSSLGSIPRVGYRTIWNRSNIDIPVGTDQGLFEDKAATTTPVAAAVVNKTKWFNSVINAAASNGTPLRTALASVGDYYSGSGATGPYGPETGSNQLSCRQNFTILTTDGYWNDSDPSIGNQDASSGSVYTAPDGTTGQYTAGYPFTDGQSNTLADMAMKYWKTDLRTDLANRVPSSTDDPAFWQHMTTFTISIGARGTLDPVATLAKIAAGTAFTWPAPTHDKVTTIDDLFHAAINGHGSFVVASDPTTFVSALSSALQAISQRTSSSSNATANSASLSTGTQLFQSTFTTGTWTGDLEAYPVDTNGNVASSPAWQASAHMPVWSSRRIFTWDPTLKSGKGGGAIFPTATQNTALGPNGSNYIKGDKSNEVVNSGTFRTRSSILGDMINSSPVYIPGDTATSSPSAIYVGANDGMLHAFDATTGAELFAYVPGGVSTSNLKTLEDPKYVHQYFVDGQIAVSTKEQTKTKNDTTGKNILVGTLGRGGTTVFALDVSDPSVGSFTIGKVLWETTLPDMGNVLGAPVITKLNATKDSTGTTIDTDNDGTTGVLIGNGPNSTKGTAVLYALNIRTGALIAEIDTKAGDTSTNSNGLSAPRGWDSDRSGTADLVYAGDLLGNLWEFNISNSDASQWGSYFKSGTTPAPFYVAKDKSGVRQPISGAVAIGLDPDTFQRWVFFGTGRYLSSGDPSDKSIQTWYGLIDQGAQITSVVTRDSSILKQRKVVAATTSDGTKVRVFPQAAAGDLTGLKGWYVDLEDESTTPATALGERIVTDTQLIGRVLLSASIIPSTDACAIGGSGYINAIDAFTGGALNPAFFDVNGDGVFDSHDQARDANGNLVAVGSINPGVGLPTLPALITAIGHGTLGVGGSGGLTSNKTNNPTNAGRISWREIIIGN